MDLKDLRKTARMARVQLTRVHSPASLSMEEEDAAATIQGTFDVVSSVRGTEPMTAVAKMLKEKSLSLAFLDSPSLLGPQPIDLSYGDYAQRNARELAELLSQPTSS